MSLPSPPCYYARNACSPRRNSLGQLVGVAGDLLEVWKWSVVLSAISERTYSAIRLTPLSCDGLLRSMTTTTTIIAWAAPSSHPCRLSSTPCWTFSASSTLRSVLSPPPCPPMRRRVAPEVIADAKLTPPPSVLP